MEENEGSFPIGFLLGFFLGCLGLIIGILIPGSRTSKAAVTGFVVAMGFGVCTGIFVAVLQIAMTNM